MFQILLRVEAVQELWLVFIESFREVRMLLQHVCLTGTGPKVALRRFRAIKPFPCAKVKLVFNLKDWSG